MKTLSTHSSPSSSTLSVEELMEKAILPSSKSDFEQLHDKPLPPQKPPLDASTLHLHILEWHKAQWEASWQLHGFPIRFLGSPFYLKDEAGEYIHNHKGGLIDDPFTARQVVLEPFADSDAGRLLAIEIGTFLKLPTTVGCDCCGNHVEAVLITESEATAMRK